jgi:hypothetical protein
MSRWSVDRLLVSSHQPTHQCLSLAWSALQTLSFQNVASSSLPLALLSNHALICFTTAHSFHFSSTAVQNNGPSTDAEAFASCRVQASPATVRSPLRWFVPSSLHRLLIHLRTDNLRLSLAVSNEYIFSGSQGSSINVFERSNYQQRPSLKGHEASVSVLSVVEDRGWLISGSGTSVILITSLFSAFESFGLMRRRLLSILLFLGDGTIRVSIPATSRIVL